MPFEDLFGKWREDEQVIKDPFEKNKQSRLHDIDKKYLSEIEKKFRN
jgi:hypothetical protein